MGCAPSKGATSRDCHFTDSPSPSLLKHLLKGEGGAAEWQSRRRLGATADRYVYNRDVDLATRVVETIQQHEASPFGAGPHPTTWTTLRHGWP